MLDTFRAALRVYANSRWGWRILGWSSIVFIVLGIGFWLMLGFGSSSGTGAGGMVLTILALILAVPAIIVFNVALAVIWALVRTLVHSVAR